MRLDATHEVPPELRKEFDRLATPPGNLDGASSADTWSAWLTGQIRNVAELSNSHPHTVRLHTECSAPKYEERNCFMFALDIEADAIRDKVLLSIFCGSEFVSVFVEKCRLRERTAPSDAVNGDIVIYCHDGNPKHAGKWADNRVISKWGSGPTHIWDHGVYEVPESYGDEVRVFRPVRDATRFYVAWAKAKGL
jgi:hypothetical protein